MFAVSCHSSAQHISMTPTADCTATGVSNLRHTCRVSQLEHKNSGYATTQQVHVSPELKPSRLPPEGNTFAHSFAAGSLDASSKAGPRPRAGRAEVEEAECHPCSHFAWELQDLYNRMAAAIAQIRCEPQGTGPRNCP